jgi:FRG domain
MIHTYVGGQWVTGQIIRTRVGHGIHTFEVDSFETFVRDILPEFAESKDQYVWRGMENPAWLLQPSLDRELSSINKSNAEQWKIEATRLTLEHCLGYISILRGLGYLEPHHETMYRALLEVRPSIQFHSFGSVLDKLTPADGAALIELLATGQHHHLVTPLLDWSTVPLISLYFAFELEQNLRKDQGSRVVYALNRTALEAIYPQNERSELVIYEALGFRNPRIVGQLGLFTLVASHQPLDRLIVTSKKIARSDTRPVLLRFLIRNVRREECLRYLSKTANIHARTVYPDIHGATKLSNANLHKEIAGGHTR